MDSLDKKVISGIIVALAFTITLYVFLSIISQDNNMQSLSPETIEKCRTMTRESADILVQTAMQSGNQNNKELQNLTELKARALEIEKSMTELRCHQTQEQWAYGSFKQEMLEYEAYIAELVRQNANK